jgi:hypothetical protein
LRLALRRLRLGLAVHGHRQVLRKIASIGANRKTITTTRRRIKHKKN